MKKFLLFFCTLILLITSCFSLLACDFGDKEPEKKYDKATVEFSATVDVGVPVALDTKATISYCKTKKGIDFVVNTTINLAGSSFKAKLYYVNGTLVIGEATGDEKIVYQKEKIGTVSDLIDQTLEIPAVNAIYEFVVDVAERNDVTIDIKDIKKNLITLPEFKNGDKIDLADKVQMLLEILSNIKDENIYDFVVGLIVDSQGVPSEQRDIAISMTKEKVSTLLQTLFDDDVTVGTFLDTVLAVIDSELTLDNLLTQIDGLIASLSIQPQELVDLINTVLGSELPDVQEGQTFTNYLVTIFNGLAYQSFQTASYKDIKVCDIISMITESPFSFEAANVLPTINDVLTNMTFKLLIQQIGTSIDENFEADSLFETLANLEIQKFTIKLNHCTNGNDVFVLPKVASK